jgi:hypothetical protein
MSIGTKRPVCLLQATAYSLTDNPLEHKHCLQPGCSFDGPDRVALDNHLQQDHFQCVGCKRIFQSHTKLNQHSENCNFAISCPQCRQPYAGQAQLAVHFEHCFLCEECGFCTNHEGNYKIVSNDDKNFYWIIEKRVLIYPVAYDKARIGNGTVLGLRRPNAHIL